MHEFSVRPKVFVSRCLGFDACRWNGATIPDDFVEKLKSYVDFVHDCPEFAVGLGVPRTPVRIVIKDNTEYLVQLDTQRDITQDMHRFSTNLLDSLEYVDGFILNPALMKICSSLIWYSVMVELERIMEYLTDDVLFASTWTIRSPPLQIWGMKPCDFFL